MPASQSEQVNQEAQEHFRIGNEKLDAGDARSAAIAFVKAIELQPQMHEAYCNAGIALRQVGLLDASIQMYRAAIKLREDVAELHCNLGVALAQTGKIEEAIECYRQAIELQLGYVAAHYNLGNAMRDLRRWGEAIEAYRKAIELDPKLAIVHNNLGLALKEIGDVHGAISAYSKSIELDPDSSHPRWNAALAYLTLGDMKRGWENFEYRRQMDPPSDRPMPGPRWQGEEIVGRTLLVNWEMGLGDTLQFVRFVPEVVRRFNARVIVECQLELYELLKQMPDVSVISERHALPAFDVRCSMMSLPSILKVQSEGELLGKSAPYLTAPPARAEFSKERIDAYERLNGRELRVGLAWAGRPAHQNDSQRSVHLRTFNDLARINGMELYSLQVGEAGQQVRDVTFRIVDWTSRFDNMAATAGLMEQLDLVIAVDTSVAHLAGALGKPVWLMLAKNPDWRWMQERSDSPWYPTMRLFRQRREGDWSEVVGRIIDQLQLHIARAGE